MVEPGATAVVHLVGRLADGPDEGTVFQTTDVDVALAEGVYEGDRDYRPLSVEVGAGEVPPAVDRALRDLEPGESTTVELAPDEAFGRRREARVVEVPRAALEARSDATAEEGELVASEDGDAGWITDVGDRTVTVDFNHELADRRVAYEVRLLTVEDEPSGGDDEESGR